MSKPLSSYALYISNCKTESLLNKLGRLDEIRRAFDKFCDFKGDKNYKFIALRTF